jgi:protein disulfide-isomerase A6
MPPPLRSPRPVLTPFRFYAPWCGHCQSLKPAFEKAAKNLAGLAKVAAVNCDDKEANQNLCAQMGVQGFPTLKIIKPGKKPGRPVVEDYQGPRSTKGIVDAVVDKIPNHVKRLQDSGLQDWLADTTTFAKAILFTEKSTTSALIRSLAIDFLGSISIAQMGSKEEAAVEQFGISKFPSMVLLLGADQGPIIYTDEMKKEALVKFLSQVSTPNPDPAPTQGKPSKPTKDFKSAAKKSSQSASFSSASEAHKSSDFDDYLAESTIVLDENTPTESPLPIVETNEKPIVVPEAIPTIPRLSTPAELELACLAPKSGTCILVLLPATADDETDLPGSATQALAGFAEISDKHSKRHDHTFPFYGIPAQNTRAATIRGELGLKDSSAMEIIAINNKRNWWRHYTEEKYSANSLETFVDAIKLGEGTKSKLPEGFGSTLDFTSTARTAQSTPDPEPEQEPEPTVVDDSTPLEAGPEPENTPEPDHDEL